MNTATSTTKEKESERYSLLSYLPWFAGLFAVLLVAMYALAFKSVPWNERPDAWGQFGDYIGGLLNPLVSLFTLMVAVAVWRLQKKELEETRKVLQRQAEHLDQSNQNEEQDRNEKIFNMLMDKLADAAASAEGQQRHSLEYINSLGGLIWSHQGTHGGPNFVTAYERRSQNDIDSIVEAFKPKINSYAQLAALALSAIERKIADREFFVKVFCAQLGSAQVSLLCYLGCSTHYVTLHDLIQSLSVHKVLPENELRQHLEYGWYKE
jgi:hypothetical protein